MESWLLAPEQPAVRYRTLTELLGRSEGDPAVRQARADLYRTGWVADLLRERDAGGWWASPESLYTPKYLSTNWRMLLLSELGASREEPRVRDSCEFWMRRMALRGGGVGGNSNGKGHHCVVGNMTRALIRLGYADDRRIRKSLEWLVETASPKGGWSCWGSGRNLDSWEGLSAFAAYPRAKWSSEMEEVVGKAAEFYLERQLYRQGGRYAPWFRFHFPVHYYYDVLVGLDLLSRLGYGRDPRMRVGLTLLRRKRRSDGRWNLDAIHPDVTGAMVRWYREHPTHRPTPLAVEPAGAPSRIITLTALNVLARCGA